MRSPTATRATRLRIIGAVLGSSVAAIILSACVGSPVDPPTSSGAGDPSSATDAPSSAPAALVPGGTAEENKPFFDATVTAQLAADTASTGQQIAAALVAAGFSASDMQLTSDTTSVGLDADSIQFSVRIGDACIVGQNGSGSGGFTSAVLAPLATGTCLVGRSVPIG